jgi:hypothetical protein
LSPLHEGSHGSSSVQSSSPHGTPRDVAQISSSSITLDRPRNPRSHPHHFADPAHPQISQPQQEHPHNYEPEDDEEELEAEILISDSRTSREAIRRFSEDIGPWDPSHVGDKRPRSEVASEQYPPDRPYKDKLQTDLEKLENDIDSREESSQPHSKKRRGRARGGNDGTRTRASRIRDKRRHDEDDGHGNGNGGVAT